MRKIVFIFTMTKESIYGELESIVTKLDLPGFIEDLQGRKRDQDAEQQRCQQQRADIEIEYKRTCQQVEQTQLLLDTLLAQHNVLRSGGIISDVQPILDLHARGLVLCSQLKELAVEQRIQSLAQIKEVRTTALQEQLYLEIQDAHQPIVCAATPELSTLVSEWPNCVWYASNWSGGNSCMMGDPHFVSSLAYPPPHSGRVLIIRKK
jgi:hypothetical protein